LPGLLDMTRAALRGRTAGRDGCKTDGPTCLSARRAIARAEHGTGTSDACYLRSLQLSGHGQIVQHGITLAMTPSDIAVVDGRRPSRIQVPEQANPTAVVIPRAMADRRAPWLRQHPVGRIM